MILVLNSLDVGRGQKPAGKRHLFSASDRAVQSEYPDEHTGEEPALSVIRAGAVDHAEKLEPAHTE